MAERTHLWRDHWQLSTIVRHHQRAIALLQLSSLHLRLSVHDRHPRLIQRDPKTGINRRVLRGRMSQILLTRDEVGR